mgnify:CR=1 FL=1
MNVTVIGAGLAGSECAWQLAQRGIQVELHEMKPEKMTPAHTTEYFAELCCSNSLRGAGLENAVGLLKEELRRLDSLILQCADATRVEAGGALAVDRHGFARLVTEKVRSHPNITVIPGEVTEIPEGEVIIASGPLTSDALAETLQGLLGEHSDLHFFDAAAPLVSFESIDMERAWFASRYDRGEADYVNCSMERDEYAAFVEALLGNPFGVAHALLIGMAQGVGAEIGFAAFRYRRWDVVSTALAGALTGLCNGGYDWLTKAGWTMTQGSRVHHLLCHLRGRVRRRADVVRAEGPRRDRRAGPLRIRTERQNGMIDSCARCAAHRSPILAYSCHHSIK